MLYRCAITTAQYYYLGQLHRGHAGDIAVLSRNPFRLNVGVLLNRMADCVPSLTPLGEKMQILKAIGVDSRELALTSLQLK